MAGVEKYEAIRDEYHKSLENFAEQQERVLEKILAKNSECEYLRRHGFEGQTDVETFKRLLPVIEYDAIEKDVDRIVAGDTSPILCCEPTIQLYLSSGTTAGKRKLIPRTQAKGPTLERYHSYLQAFTKLSSVGDAVGLGIFFCNSGKIEISPGGLPIAQASTLFFANPQFKETAPLLYISPYEVIRCGDNRQATYCHLLCGLLRSSEVTIIGAIFASGVAYAISLLKELWPDIATDIETGQLSNLVTDPAVRAQVSKILAAPNPELAEFVRAECSRESWEGIVPRLWPGVRLITGVTTGSMLQYIDYINFHTAGGILLSSTYYSGTEGQYGFNPCLLNPPHETFYVLQHNEIIYFEFIRVTGEQPEHGSQPRGQDDDDTATRLVNLAGVKEGETYEMVISNGEGLWRYRVGDVLQCVGFYHRAPKFKIVGRKNVILSIHSDKTDDKELFRVVSKAAVKHLPDSTRLYDFSSCTSLDSLPGHYVVFWEICTIRNEAGHPHLGDQVIAEACVTMEAELSEAYRRGRNYGIIAPLELRVVRPGTFDRITQGALDRGVMQFKMPRGYPAGSPDLSILNAAVVVRGRSTSVPPYGAVQPTGGH